MSTIEEQIKEQEARVSGLDAEILNLNAQLKGKKAEQENAILEGGKTAEIEGEIVALRTRLEGTGRARDLLLIQVDELKKKREAEKRDAQRAVAEQARDEGVLLAAEIYQHLTAGTLKLIELRSKVREFDAGVRGAGLRDKDNDPRVRTYFQSLTKAKNLMHHLDQVMPQVLRGFPDEIAALGNSPKFEDMHRMLLKR